MQDKPRRSLATSLGFRLANRLLGNDEGAAGIETTLAGPVLKFNADTVICLGGAELAATLDGEPITYWQPYHIKAGQVLKVGSVTGPGIRTYIAVRGGIDVPAYSGYPLAADPLRSAAPAARRFDRRASGDRGRPLNVQLAERNARLLETVRTAAGYRLYALANTSPPKPGLVFDGSGAGGIVSARSWRSPPPQHRHG